VFLLLSIVVGTTFALLLGGRLGRLVEIELRHAWLVMAALGVQIVIFSPLEASLPAGLEDTAHLASYLLLFLFAVLNVRTLPLLPIFAGMALNAIVIAANGGHMPVAASAARAAGIEEGGNIRIGGGRLHLAGDVFALPARFPFANAFSVGDLLIGIGAAALIVAVSTGEGRDRLFSPSRLVRPMRDRCYVRLALGKLFTDLGDWLTLAVLVGWVYQGTGSLTQVAGLLLVRLAPPILGGGLAALVVDRFPKQRLLVFVELARGAAIGGALAAVLVDSRPLVFAALALSGALAAISSAAVPALIPSVVDDDDLPAANAGLAIAQDAAMAVGALGGGLALSTLGAAPALGIDLATFVIAAVLYSGIRARPVTISQSPAEAGIRAGFRYLRRRRLLLVVIGGFGAATLATGLTNATLPRFLDDELGLGSGAYGYGLSALGFGLLLGEMITGFVRIGPDSVRWIGAALLAMAGLFATLALTEHAPTAILILVAIGFLDGTTDVVFDTIVQREADPRYLGRVFAVSSACMRTTMMTAVAAAPILNRISTPQDVILVAATGVLLASAVALVGTRGSVSASPRPAEIGSSP
jgi:Na+/melibiose symporter-like transporter